jgi:hypothetical protein
MHNGNEKIIIINENSKICVYQDLLEDDCLKTKRS